MSIACFHRDLPSAVGMSERDGRRYLQCVQEGSIEECLRLLRRRRAELVLELHEAQRPIDTVDYAIRELRQIDHHS